LNIAKSRVRPDLQLGADRPDMLWAKGRLRAHQLALVPGRALRWDQGRVFVIGHGHAPWLLRMTMMTRWPEEAEGTSAFGSIQQ
jgi:hypothetical protein